MPARAARIEFSHDPCDSIAFVVSAPLTADPVKIYLGMLWPTAHARLAEVEWGLAPGSYRECFWQHDDAGESLHVRVEVDEEENFYRAAILAQWPTRADMIAFIRGDRAWRPGRGEPRYKSRFTFTGGEYLLEVTTLPERGKVSTPARRDDVVRRD
jgi:hypothetical protein